MSVKVSLGDKIPAEILPYPKLKISTQTGTVVLFNGKKTGTVLSPGPKSCYKTGDYSAGWIEEDFRDYLAKVILENEV